jgi:hypothetical protein
MATTVRIVGNLPKYTVDMKPIPKYQSFISVDKVKESCHPIIPSSINWNLVTRNSWFMCIKPDDDYSYQFPIVESENRENNYERSKIGIQYFHDNKYLIYQIQ